MLQSSFLSTLAIMSQVPNIVFILFFVIIFFEDKHQYDLGFWSAVIAGFFLDNLTISRFGVAIAALLVVYFLEKLIAHFIKEQQGKFIILYFIFVFIGSYVVFNASVYLFSVLLGSQFNYPFDLSIIVALLYNLIFACVGFYVFKIFIHSYRSEKQLKLF